MRRHWAIWAAFAACLAVVLASLAWISRTALRMEAGEFLANQQAAVQEKIRLALWRMDSSLAPLIARESERPYSVYSPLVLPVRGPQSPHILLHFQFGPDGTLTSPQVREQPAEGGADVEADARNTELLAQLRATLTAAELLAALPPLPQEPQVAAAELAVNQQRGGRSSDRGQQQAQMNSSEWQARNTAIQNATATDSGLPRSLLPGEQVRQSLLQARWIGKELVLARRVNVGAQTYVQGCWLNWPELRSWLLAGVQDLLPHADLAPPPAHLAAEDPLLLASLPVKLLPGAVSDDLPEPSSPIRLSLIVAWLCVLLGALAVAVLLHGALRLSERRGEFVSAVTHELRTPLTTFQLYTDLLAGGMIADEAKRAGYLLRLQEESQRLGHLVENVLAYARLTAPRSGSRAARVTLGELVERSSERLTARCQRAGMRLQVEIGQAAAASVWANVSAVEQILMNLVDNACKYAGRAADRTVHLQAEVADGSAVLRVRDHGPGIAPGQARRLFRAFSRSAQEAAGSPPGVGLGLALSRRLARDMRGDLRLDRGLNDGACLALILPLARP